MELKSEQIAQGRQSLSPEGDRTISLRDLRVTAIANLGVTRDGYDCIDLSNNEIRKLDNIPLLPRLRTLVVAGNRISKISDTLSDSVPNLTSLVLAGNNIAQLADLTPLFKLTKLERLSLLDNPVIAVPHFTEYMVFRLPSLRYLNFCKIAQKDRLAAAEFFRTEEGLSLLREQGYDPFASLGGVKERADVLAMMEKTTDVGSLLELEKRLMQTESGVPSAI
ncbi:U2 small nuclear ribonucleoprotein A [Babesia ovata]|uniref:U2 small nuclear ribonucleoprotein A n=1 Tax=Babesia ovata TaxID=189622 RepID=A0A2H6K9F7_9APIC|nr:U2 small nuclear ribonucleoprotein A [Babesia ovata]GBE59589.1 U2 small nuclear ribonucleoprotein A [Babesia ovata]